MHWDGQLQYTLLFLSIPLMALLALLTNAALRVRNRRSFRFEIRAFGVEVKLESTDSSRKVTQDETENPV